MKKELIAKIMQKKEFSQLPKKDIGLAFKKFDREKYGDEEKVKLTRNLLRQVYSAFTSPKILSLKDKNPEWILRKHLSTRERLSYYEEIYKRIFNSLIQDFRHQKKNYDTLSFENNFINSKKEVTTVIDLGAGINGFSYKYFKQLGYNVDYIAIEAIGQFVKLMNYYFKKEKLNAKAFHLSLFQLTKVKEIIKKTKKPRIVFLFKTLDSLEMLKMNYSKKLISEIASLSDRIVISFATESMIKRKKFKVKRNWILDFIKEKFNILDDFEFRGERYLILEIKKSPVFYQYL